MRRPQDINVRQQSPLTPVAQHGPLVAVIVAAIVAVDQLTKWWAETALTVGSCSRPDACIDLFWTLRLRLIYNSGASFGTGSSFGPIIGVISWVMAGVMIWLAIKPDTTLARPVYAAIAGGAIGNGIDRLVRAEDGFMSGAVVDFIDFQWWPVFNIADSAIVIAVAFAILGSFKHRDSAISDDGLSSRGADVATASTKASAASADPLETDQ